jgi:hypothetical protein
MDNDNSFFAFAIIHKDNPKEALGWLTPSSSDTSLEVATDFANQEFEEYKNSLLLKSEDYGEISDDSTTFYFSVIHKDDPTEVLKRLTIPAETQEIATDFANQEFEEYKNGLLFDVEKISENDDVVVSRKDAIILPQKNYPENLVSDKDEVGFAWFPAFLDSYRDLADTAETEDWEYHFTSTRHERPILINYIKYTYKQLVLEKKITISKDGRFSCFNTGLVTNNEVPIYAFFETNDRKDAQPWVFKGWLRDGNSKLKIFPQLPDIASYYDDPACLFFDSKKEFHVNYEHILENSRRERFPESYKSMSDYALQNILKGSIENARKRVHRNYNTAIPCFYRGKIHLLLPLCLKDQKHADLALAIDAHENGYRVATCLTLAMAYNDARLLAKPNREWLVP